jgi:hypothetical protein
MTGFTDAGGDCSAGRLPLVRTLLRRIEELDEDEELLPR